jgi:hypothetical protein
VPVSAEIGIDGPTVRGTEFHDNNTGGGSNMRTIGILLLWWLLADNVMAGAATSDGALLVPYAGRRYTVSFTLDSGTAYNNVMVLYADDKVVEIETGGKVKKIPRTFIKTEDSKRIPNQNRVQLPEPKTEAEQIKQTNEQYIEARIKTVTTNGFWSESWRFYHWNLRGEKSYYVWDGPNLRSAKELQQSRIFISGLPTGDLLAGETWNGMVVSNVITNDADGVAFRLMTAKQNTSH